VPYFVQNPLGAVIAYGALAPQSPFASPTADRDVFVIFGAAPRTPPVAVDRQAAPSPGAAESALI
jgi:hypothetical protein